MALTITNFVQDQIDELNSTFGGAILEQGSNTYGYWYKFAGGLLVQRGKNVKSSTNTGTSKPVNIIFPTGFYDTNINLMGQICDVDTNIYTVVKSVIISTAEGQVITNQINNNSYTGYVYVDWIAIGRWQ